MRNERLDLICESEPKKLGELLSYIFSDQYIYVHPPFRRIIQNDRKGYVHLDSLVKQQILASFFQENGIKQQSRKAILQYVVNHFCSELLFTNNRIRRVSPFNHKLFKNIKPLCLQRIQTPLTISDVRHYLGQSAFSQIQNFNPHQQIQFQYVHAPDYREKWNRSSPAPFKVIQYQKLCEERERESRYWEQQEKRFYMKINIEDRPQRQYRQQYIKQENRNYFRGNSKDRRHDFDEDDIDMEQQKNQLPYEQIKMLLKPNAQLNQMLNGFIIKMENSLDQQ